MAVNTAKAKLKLKSLKSAQYPGAEHTVLGPSHGRFQFSRSVLWFCAVSRRLPLSFHLVGATASPVLLVTPHVHPP
jgi:hypothetical protein